MCNIHKEKNCKPGWVVDSSTSANQLTGSKCTSADLASFFNYVRQSLFVMQFQDNRRIWHDRTQPRHASTPRMLPRRMMNNEELMTAIQNTQANPGKLLLSAHFPYTFLGVRPARHLPGKTVLQMERYSSLMAKSQIFRNMPFVLAFGLNHIYPSCSTTA